MEVYGSMIKRLCRGLPLLAWSVLASGCASTYYDPLPPVAAQLRSLAPSSTHTLESAFRVLYEQLDACYGHSYHVQPRFERAASHAWIMLVSGLGLNRLSLIGNQFQARVDLRADASGVHIELRYHEPRFATLNRQAESWLAGDRSCSR